MFILQISTVFSLFFISGLYGLMREELSKKTGRYCITKNLLFVFFNYSLGGKEFYQHYVASQLQHILRTLYYTFILRCCCFFCSAFKIFCYTLSRYLEFPRFWLLAVSEFVSEKLWKPYVFPSSEIFARVSIFYKESE